jgi:hypothetical protein
VALFATTAPALAATPNDVVVSESPAKKTPNVLDGSVNAIVRIGNTIVVGGTFTKVKEPGGSTFDRSHIFSFNATTFAINRNFKPVLDREVDALASGGDGHSVMVGGRFNSINGFARKGLVKLNLATGHRITAFKARPAGAVLDLARAGGRLYVAGNFPSINGKEIAALASVNETTGAVNSTFNLHYADPRSTATTHGALGVANLARTPNGTRLVTAGNFQHVDGLDRNQLAIIDLSTSPASVANWETDLFKFQCPSQRKPAWTTDVAMSRDGAWFTVTTTGAYANGQLCDTASRWEVNMSGSNLQPTWVDWTGGDSLFSAAVTDVAVYVGGHQRWMNNPLGNDSPGPGAVPRSGIAALDPANGLPLAWDPGRSPRGQGVFALVPTSTGLWVGSDTNYIDGQYRAKLAFMPSG